MSARDFNVRERYFEPEQYILEGWLDVKSWAAKSASFGGFGGNSFKRIRNRMHSWRSVYCVLDMKTTSFKYYNIRRSEEDEVPDVTNLIPKLTLLISDSDVIDISMDKHGKSDNFIISVDNCNQLLLSADSEELKARWMFTFENLDDIRDDIVLSTVNCPRKVFASQKKTSGPKSFSRMPVNQGMSSTDIEDAEERKLAELAIACLEDSDWEDDDDDDDDKETDIGERNTRIRGEGHHLFRNSTGSRHIDTKDDHGGKAAALVLAEEKLDETHGGETLLEAKLSDVTVTLSPP